MKNVYVYIIIPAAVSILLTFLYFSGVPALQQIMAPTIPSLQSDSWREFGLLESLQNICLFLIVIFAAMGAVKKRSMYEKGFAVVIALAALFVFLEEIDYGLHYYEFITGTVQVMPGHRNWHNQGEGMSYARRLKPVVDALMICLFVVFPLTLQKVKHPLVQYLLPSRWFVAFALIIIVSSNLAHILDDAGYGIINGIKGNLSRGDISEFRELYMYYGYMIYVYGLVFWKGNTVLAQERTGVRPLILNLTNDHEACRKSLE